MNDDVGRIGTNHGGMRIPDEGMTMVDTVDSSNMLVTRSLADRVISDVLLGEHTGGRPPFTQQAH